MLTLFSSTVVDYLSLQMRVSWRSDRPVAYLGEKLGSEWRESSSVVKIDYKVASQICKMMIGDDGPSW